MDNRKLYQQYIDISNSIAELTAQKKYIAEKILKKMTIEKLDKVEGEKGIIKLAQRPKWIYSSNVIKKADELVELKHIEENTGVAKQEITQFLRVSLR